MGTQGPLLAAGGNCHHGLSGDRQVRPRGLTVYSSTYCSRHAPPATRTDQLATSVFPLAIKRDACVFGFAFVLCSCSVVWLAGVFVCLASGLFSGINYELGTK